jgi:hypothetical protein
MRPPRSELSCCDVSLSRSGVGRQWKRENGQRTAAAACSVSRAFFKAFRSHDWSVTNDSRPKSEHPLAQASLRRLGKRAAQIVENLRLLHWDNCKVNFDRRMAYRYALRALRDGNDAANILKRYERALQECHALATDRTASRGQICRFELSSTVRRAKRFLANDAFPIAEPISPVI